MNYKGEEMVFFFDLCKNDLFSVFLIINGLKTWCNWFLELFRFYAYLVVSCGVDIGIGLKVNLR